MYSRRHAISLFGAIVIGAGLLPPGNAVAEPRYNFPGFEIDIEEWLDDSEGDLVQYFIERRGNYRGPWESEEEIYQFLERFNRLVLHGIFDDLDCRIVWYRKFAVGTETIFRTLLEDNRYRLMSRNTFNDRIKKIRHHMRIAYGHRS